RAAAVGDQERLTIDAKPRERIVADHQVDAAEILAVLDARGRTAVAERPTGDHLAGPVGLAVRLRLVIDTRDRVAIAVAVAITVAVAVTVTVTRGSVAVARGSITIAVTR